MARPSSPRKSRIKSFMAVAAVVPGLLAGPAPLIATPHIQAPVPTAAGIIGR